MKTIAKILSMVIILVGVYTVYEPIQPRATAICEAEDNCTENGYYMYCETETGDKLFVPMNDIHEGEKFTYKIVNGIEAEVVQVIE